MVSAVWIPTSWPTYSQSTVGCRHPDWPLSPLWLPDTPAVAAPESWAVLCERWFSEMRCGWWVPEYATWNSPRVHDVAYHGIGGVKSSTSKFRASFGCCGVRQYSSTNARIRTSEQEVCTPRGAVPLFVLHPSHYHQMLNDDLDKLLSLPRGTGFSTWRIVNGQRFGRRLPLHPQFHPCWTIRVESGFFVQWTGVQPVVLRLAESVSSSLLHSRFSI